MIVCVSWSDSDDHYSNIYRVEFGRYMRMTCNPTFLLICFVGISGTFGLSRDILAFHQVWMINTCTCISERFCKNMLARFLPGFGCSPNPGLASNSKPRGCSVKAGPGTWPSQWPICCWLAGVQVSKTGGGEGRVSCTDTSTYLDLKIRVPNNFVVDCVCSVVKACLNVLCWHGTLLEKSMSHACREGVSYSPSCWECLQVNYRDVFANTVRYTLYIIVPFGALWWHIIWVGWGIFISGRPNKPDVPLECTKRLWSGY